MQVLTRRLITAPQKLVAISANTQASQTAACACLAAAFGTKGGLPSVANLLCAPLPQAADMAAAAAVAAPARQHALINTLLELSCSGKQKNSVTQCILLLFCSFQRQGFKAFHGTTFATHRTESYSLCIYYVSQHHLHPCHMRIFLTCSMQRYGLVELTLLYIAAFAYTASMH